MFGVGWDGVGWGEVGMCGREVGLNRGKWGCCQCVEVGGKLGLHE